MGPWGFFTYLQNAIEEGTLYSTLSNSGYLSTSRLPTWISRQTYFGHHYSSRQIFFTNWSLASVLSIIAFILTNFNKHIQIHRYIAIYATPILMDLSTSIYKSTSILQ